jgi:acetyl esterase/lipase
MVKTACFGLVGATLVAAGLAAQSAAPAATVSASPDWAARLQSQYQVAANVTYLTASGTDLKVDVYRRRDVTTPQKTMVFFHGGGWILGSKENSFMSTFPWFEMGWNVVNVQYRFAKVAEAPAAVEDVQCALRFIAAQAKTYNVDTTKIVVMGESAGGHLALAAGMIPESAGFTNICAGGGFNGNEIAIPKVAAIINWYGISDVNDMLVGGANPRSYAVQWLGSRADKADVAKRVSPLTYVRAGLPPILTIHGDADPIVPFSHATRLHEALKSAGTQNELFPIPGGGHGQFKPDERTRAYVKIREFLAKNGLM